MVKFASTELELKKNVKKGDRESLLTLFGVKDRLKRMEVLTNVEEGEKVTVELSGLGKTELVLGNDMEKGDRKTIMTLFWLPEKSNLFEIKQDAKAGDYITMDIWC